MIRVRHIFPNHSCRAESLEPVVGCFVGEAASWASWYISRQSRYEGWFVAPPNFKHHFLKLIERIEPIREGKVLQPSSLIHTPKASFFEYPNMEQLGFSVPENLLGLSIQLKAPLSTVSITLDIRGMYALPELGRQYQLSEEEGLLIRYEDPTLEGPVFLHLRFGGIVDKEERWEAVSYPRDAARHSEPSTRYTFRLGSITASRLDCGFGLTKEEALATSKAVAEQPFPEIPISLSKPDTEADQAITVATSCAHAALQTLSTADGLYAGLPWFHQVWTRDELLAALGLTPAAQLAVIDRYLELKPYQGELPTFVGSGTTCSDGLGWLCLLIREYGVEKLTAEKRAQLQKLLEESYEGLRLYRRYPNGLLYSNWNSSWMDTIGRAGFPLEIQCMYALVLELLFTLTKEEKHQLEQTSLLHSIRTEYFSNQYLKDTTDKPEKRPNVFLAYLLQPALLTVAEWERCFTTVLDATYQSWGGLSSLERENPAFQPESTGEDNRSYHNGDSWFFINNLAVVALQRLNAAQFQGIIRRLLQGSTQEILWRNFIGCPGEIASAGSGISWGCGIQAFSAGSYLFAISSLQTNRNS